MHFLTRVTLTAVAASTVLGMTSPEFTQSLKGHLGSIPGLIRTFLYERERGQRLNELDARIAARSEAKRRLFGELASGRLSLPEATARFQELCADAPEARDASRILFESGSDEERLCRLLIHCVENELDSPAQKRAVRRRLNAELEARLCSGGPLVGP
jgi:hypothetical protein